MARIAHPFDKTPWNSYGFEKGQELEWFEWLCNYRDALKELRDKLEKERYTCDIARAQYITTKEEIVHIRGLINAYVLHHRFRPYHKAFLKSTKIDMSDKIRLKNKLLKTYEEGEFKDGKYYLSIVNTKL